MIPKNIPIPLPGGSDFSLPRFIKVSQRFSDHRLGDLEARVAQEMGKHAGIPLAGKTVAVGLGSRGIRPQPPVARAVIAALKEAGAKPFVVPAMGSHGGGTAEGQREILENYGMTEDYLGVPIKASMEVVQLGELDDGCPVYCDRNAYEADYIVPCNRVKPHTDFRGKHESGLIKMMAIGLAKHSGAEAIHRQGFERFPEVLPASARIFLEKANVLFGVAMVENAYDKLLHLELVPKDQIFERDAALLEIAKANIPRFLFPQADVLVLDQIGKDISGAGMDPNATGRPGTGLPGFDNAPDFRQIVVRDLTEATHGNATGIAGADVTTQRVVSKMDWTATYVNVVTSGVLAGGKLPIVANTDREAIDIALRGCPRTDPAGARIVRATNTLELAEIWMTEPMREDVEASSSMQVISDPFDAKFDAEGALQAFA